MVSETLLNKFREKLRGELIGRDDEQYEAARKVYNAIIDRRPEFIARCVDVADVIAAVGFGRQSGLPIAIRGGGHSGPGLGSVDDGLVIDLQRMKGIRVNPLSRTVRVEGGCTWGDVDHATHPFGLATPGGFISTTGVGGLTLGGGIGYLSRQFGLTIDNLLGVDVVLADASFVHANPDENPDLFWAVRGGGGNFGVVTSFCYQLHPVRNVYGGPMLWPMEDGARLLARWRDYIFQAPEEINGWFAFLSVPPEPPFPEEFHFKKMCMVVWCDTGSIDQAEKRFAAISRKLGSPAIDFTGPMPWPLLQSLFDLLLPPGLRWHWKTDFFNDLSDRLIDLHLKYGTEMPTPLSTMHLYPINGAVRRVGAKQTAFRYRKAAFAEVIMGIDSDPANDKRISDWAGDYWRALHPHSAGGGYVNMIMDEGLDQVKAAYGDNYDRLAVLKNKYDPTNVFHVNQNIKPSV